MNRTQRMTAALLLTAFPGAAHAATFGYVDSFATAASNTWSGGSSVTRPATGGVGGAGDGFLRIATSFAFNLGARTTSPNYQGDWISAGITEMSLWLNDVGNDEDLEIHVLISDGAVSTSWQYNPGFQPPHGCWKQFHVDLTDSSRWTQTRGDASFEEVLRNVERVTIRHDRPPYFDSPDSIVADVGVDDIRLGPMALDCPDVFGDSDGDGDVDQDDFGTFQVCFTGPCSVRPAICACFDHDRDGHVDASDFTVFERCISGPAIPATPGCEQE